MAAIHALREAGDHESARAQMLLLAQQHPQDAAIQYAAACLHDSLGYEREAVPFYLAAIQLGLPDPDLRGAYLGLGSTYRTLGAYAESEQTFRAGLARFPDAAELQVFLAMTLYNRGHHHDSIALLLRALAETSQDPNLRIYSRAIRFYADDLDRIWP
jgi:tetratricopeptide (TPR) repeat protein